MQSLHRDGIDGYPLISLWTGAPPHSLAMSTPWPFYPLWIAQHLLQVASLLYSLLQQCTHLHACMYVHMYVHTYACMYI